MNPQRRLMTLDEFTIQELRNFPSATGELGGLLRDIGLAAKRVNVEVNKAGLVDILGDAGKVNVQGEDVKKLSYIQYCSCKDKATGRPYTYRYIGSMVADIHRNLIKGGLFGYPPTGDKPGGKLRLLYECNPMAFIVEVAGGKALVDEHTRVLDVKPHAIHQRTPMYIGSANMVDQLLTMLKTPEKSGI